MVVWAEDGFWSQIKVPLNAGTGMEVIRKNGVTSQRREKGITSILLRWSLFSDWQQEDV